MSEKINVFTYAKQIRNQGEPWKDAVSRASQELRSRGITHVHKSKSPCAEYGADTCTGDCHWIKQSKSYTTKSGKKASRNTHCAKKPAK